MQYSAKNIVFFIILALSNNAFSYEFKLLKLKGELAARNQEKINRTANRAGNRAGTLSSQKVELAPILTEILTMLDGQHEQIGKAQVNRLIKNHDMGGGVLNFSGFTWYKPMLNYDIKVNRELSPNFKTSSPEDEWIVHDTFTIFIDAATLISNLTKSNQLGPMSKSSIGAFAGVTFKRVYKYSHFEKSYLDGLKSDFTKLFLPIGKFNPEGVLLLKDYEIIKRSDTFTFNAGGIVAAPISSGLNGQAGVLVNVSYANDILLQKLGSEDNIAENELMRVSINKKYNKSVGAHISAQYEFFNLLKLELFRFDLTYEFGEANRTDLTFFTEDKRKLLTPGPHRAEFDQFLKGKDDVRLWEKNIVMQEQRLSENLNSKFSFLLLGTIKKRATEQIRIVKDGVQKIFFKHYSESVQFIQSFFSRLFSKVVQKVFKFETTVRNKAEFQKLLKIEYEQMRSLGPATVDKEDKFSLQFKQFFMVANTKKWYHKSSYKKAIRYTRNLTNLPSDLIKKVEDKQLVGPISINSTIEIQEQGLKFFNKLTRPQIKNFAFKLCKIKNLNRTRRGRRGPRKKYSQGQKCAIRLMDRFDNYMQTFESSGRMDLMAFKRFTGLYFSKVKSSQEVYQLFGESNVFRHGNFQAKTRSGDTFQTFFKSGLFRGLGVIDAFKRKNSITPVSN